MAVALAALTKLPEYNGNYKAGIAVGIDPSLASSEKLHLQEIPTDMGGQDPDDVRSGCFTLIMRDLYARHCVSKLALATEIFMYGVYAGIHLGFIAQPGEGMDMVYANLSALESNEADHYFGDELDKNKLLNALSIAVATKACWWATNHHLGGEKGKLGGYLLKVFNSKYAASGADMSVITDAIYKPGHFFDTCRVLEASGVPNIKWDPDTRVKLSDECMLRFKSMPMGTHRLAVAYEAARRLLGSKLAAFCPQVFKLNAMVPKRDIILADPARFHVGAYYLTGSEKADYNDLDNTAYMARLSSFLRIFMSFSTLTKSPHFSNHKIESYPDFNADWNSFLTRVRTASAAATRADLEALNQLDTAVRPDLFKNLVHTFPLTVTPGQMALLLDDSEG